MDLALHFPCVYPLIRAKSSNLFLSEIADAPSPSFGQSLSRTAFNGDRRIRPREKASSSSSMGRSKKGSVCCKKPSDERTSNQEEIISLFRRIQSSISKGESRGAEEKNRDGTSENESLTKAILDVLEKPRKKTEGDTRAKEQPEKRVKVARPPSSFAKRSPIRRPSALGPRGKLPVSKSDIALEDMTEKEEKAPLIETMKLAELKEVAKNRGIKGYSKLKKSELLKLIRSA